MYKNKAFSILKSVLIFVILFSIAFGDALSFPFIKIETAEASDSKYNNDKITGTLGWHATPYSSNFTEAHLVANTEWIANNFKEYGYEYICLDGWVGDATTHNEDGYISKYKNNWAHDWKYWADYVHSKGLKLGIYYNPSWLHEDFVIDDSLKVAGTDIPLQNIVIKDPKYMHQTRYMVNPDAEGSKEYVQGMINYYISQGVDLLKIDFLRYYENAYGHAAVKKLYEWMREAAGDDLILYYANTNNVNHAVDEVATANLLRASEDWRTDAAQPGVWFHTSNRNKGQIRVNTWPPAYNLFDGLISMSDLSGRGKVAIDGDYSVLSAGNNASTDAEKKTRISLLAMAGSSINIGDRYNEIGSNGFYYTNWEILDLNKQGFHAEPLTQDNKNPLSQIWKGKLPDDTWIVALFNREDTPQARSIHFASDLGLTGDYLVSDMWSHAQLGAMASYSETIAPHSTRLLKISKLSMEPYGAYFTGSQKVTLSALDPNADIRYTLDGSDPGVNGVHYNGPFNVEQSTTVRAKIVQGDGAGYEARAMFIETNTDPIDQMASLLTAVAAPMPGDTQLLIPETSGGYSVSIFNSSNENIVDRNGKIVQPEADTTINLILQIKRESDGETRNSSAIQVKVPGITGSPGDPDPREGIVYPGSTAAFTVNPGGPNTSRASGGNSGTGQYLQTASAPKVNDWVELTLNVPEAGDYKIEFGYKTNNNRGITQLYVDGVEQGSPVDQYKSVQEFLAADLGQVRFSTSGPHPFRFVVTGKNTSSSSTNLTFDYIKLIKIETDVDLSPEEVAGGITSIPAPERGASQLALPAVPDGFSITIQQSLNPAVVSSSGLITQPAADTIVYLVFEVTRSTDGLTAVTDELPVLILGSSSGGGSGNTAIQFKSAHPYLTSINNSNHTITVLGGATVADMLEQLTSTDHSEQSYTVMSTGGSRDPKNPIPKKLNSQLASGDKVNVQAEDGQSSQSYTITVQIPKKMNMPYEVNVIAENLHIPWAFDMASDQTIYFTERNGKIRVMRNDVLEPQPIIDLSDNLFLKGESGLLGLALDPDFDQNRFMYVYQSYIKSGTAAANRVLRLIISVDGNSATIDKTLLDDIPATATNGNGNHSGGRIKIGPDGLLYITTGETYVSTKAQDLNDLGGKILRMNLDGSIPGSNPFVGHPSANPYIYSYGHRNPQGLAWQPGTNLLFSSEHGDVGHDEINIIETAGNYGWPLIEGDSEAESNGVMMKTPILHTGTDRLAPSGITFIRQGPWSGKLFVTNLRGSQLILLTLEDDRIIEEAYFNSEYGRIRDVFEDKQGNIYISSSNHSDPDKDRIIKLTPKTIDLSDTKIQAKAGSTEIIGIDLQSFTVKVETNATVSSLLNQIESSSGAVQRYIVKDSSGMTKPQGILATGDILTVEAQNGRDQSSYTIVASSIRVGTQLTYTSNKTAAPANDSNAYLNGTHLQFASTAVGDWIDFAVDVPAPGRYQVIYSHKKHTSRGISQLFIDGAQQGAPVDQYIAAPGFVRTDLGDVTLTEAGSHSFKLVVTGKNPSSGGANQYNLSIDYFELIFLGDLNSNPPEQPEEPEGPKYPGEYYPYPDGLQDHSDPSVGDTYYVKQAQIKDQSMNGKVRIEVADEISKLIIPDAIGEWLGEASLHIRSVPVSFTIPASVFKQIMHQAEANHWNEGYIVLSYHPVPAEDARLIIASGERSSQAQLQLKGNIYQISLTYETNDGRSAAITNFTEPITVSIKSSLLEHKNLTGIYHITSDYQLEYIGGQYADEELTANLSHFSMYGVFVYNKSFDDVPSAHWAYSTIQEMAAKQIVHGITAELFEPDRAITRAEFTTLLVNALKLSKAGELQFADVKATDWYAPAISIAVGAGIVTGKTPAVFDPEGLITREEMAAMIIRGYEVKHEKKLGLYPDPQFQDYNQVSAWAENYVNAASDLGFIAGRRKGLFVPQGKTTRAEAAQVISKLIKK